MSTIKLEDQNNPAARTDYSSSENPGLTSSISQEQSGDLNNNSIQNPCIVQPTENVQNSGNQNSSNQVAFSSDFASSDPLGNQQNELVFDLNWCTKNELTSHLNDFSAFLLISDDKSRSDEPKKKLVKQNSDLLSLLASLPLKSTKRKCGELVDNDVSNEAKLIVTLSWSARAIIVNHLFNNVGYGLLDDLIISKETKLNLIHQNNKTIQLLMNLPIDLRMFCQGAANDDANEPDAKKQKANEAANQAFKGEINEQMIQFRKEVQDIKDVLKSKCALMTNLKSEIGTVKSELSDKIDQVDINRAEATFEFELTDVAEFFANDNDRYSDVFFVRGLPFSINVEFKKKDDQIKQMGIYLYCHNNDSVKWSCSTNYKLKVVSYLPGVPDKEKEFHHLFNKQTGFGNSKFISVSDLMDQSKGFVRDDTIKLVVQLKADRVIRLK